MIQWSIAYLGLTEEELFAQEQLAGKIVTGRCFVRYHRFAVSALFLCSVGLAQPPAKDDKSPPEKNQSKDPPGLEKSKLRPREGNLKVGDKVPALKVWDIEGKKEVALRELEGKPTVLIFGSCT